MNRFVVSGLCAGLICLTLLANVHRAISLGMPANPPSWVATMIPAALSDVVFHAKSRYTILKPVSIEYRKQTAASLDGDHVNRAINSVLQLDAKAMDQSYDVLPDDDKGLTDLIALGFRLFGVKTESVLSTYYLILLGSCLAFLIAFFRRPACLLILVLFLAMFYLILPTIRFNPQLGSVLAPRVLPLLSMVACLHLILFALQPLRGALQVGLLIAQAAVLIFAVHLRTTAAWQTTLVGLVSAAAAFRYAWQAPRRRVSVPTGLRAALLALLPLCLVAAGHLGLRAYQNAAFPREYHDGQHMVTRVFWHNIFSGLAFQPEFADRYALRIDDYSIVRALRQYLDERGRGDEFRSLMAGPTLNSGIYWGPYDQLVREMLVARCGEFPWECLSAEIEHKPRSLLGHLAWLYGLRAEPPDLDVWVLRQSIDGGPISMQAAEIVKAEFLNTSHQLDSTGLRAYLWTAPAVVLMLAVAGLLACATRRDLTHAWLGAVLLACGSLIPIEVGYPGPHTIGEVGVATGMLMYLGLCTGLRPAVHALALRVHVPAARSQIEGVA